MNVIIKQFVTFAYLFKLMYPNTQNYLYLTLLFPHVMN